MKIIIIGGYGFGNLGDEAILEGTIKILQRIHRKDDLLVFSFNPKETSRLHDVKSKRVNITDLIKSDKVIVGGGGLFFDAIMRDFILLILVSKFLGKEVEIFRVGVSESKSKINRLLIKLAFNMVNKISVRDKKSESILRSYGVSKNIDVLDDPAYSVFDYSDQLKKRSTKIESIGISLRLINDDIVDKNTEDVFTEFINYVTNKYKIKVYFVPFCINNEVPFENDMILANRIEQRLKNKKEFITLVPKNTDDLVNIFRKFDIFIGMRLHSLIFSTTNNIPSIGIAYADKIKYAVKKNIKTIDLDNLSFKNLVSEFESVGN